MSFVRAYLRASTKEQNASRAKDQLDAFARERGFKVAKLLRRKRERCFAATTGAVSAVG